MKNILAEQLIRSERLAGLGRVITDIAHEMRNPVTIIQATVDLMEPKVQRQPELSECINMIQEQLKRQGNFITDLLNFGNPAQVTMEPFDVHNLLHEILYSIEALFEKNQIQLSFVSSETIPPVVGNREKLAQVFTNMIINAIQAMPNGGLLTVRAFKDEGLVCISFRDTGVGIPQENISQIFEPFYSKKAGGTGLGLAISKNIVEIHRGSINVESQPGQGTTFTICFPLLEKKEVKKNVSC